MARVDDYRKAFELGAEKLSGMNFFDASQRAGADCDDSGDYLELGYYGRSLRVNRDPVTVVSRDEGPEVPVAEQALILHYLTGASGKEPGGDWITYREVPSGEFYWPVFVKRAKAPLVDFFGQRPELLYELAPLVGGERAGGQVGDAAVVVQAFPRIPLLIQLWAGDEEFPADGNVLFDETVSSYLPTEDIALVAGLPVYKMMALASQQQ